MSLNYYYFSESPARYAYTENTKLFDCLISLLKRKGNFESRGSYRGLEYKMANYGKSAVYILFVVNQKYSIQQHFVTGLRNKVLREAVKRLPPETQTRKHFANDDNIIQDIDVYDEDYTLFSDIVSTLLIYFCKNQPDIRAKFFYKAQHGEKRNAKTQIEEMKSSINHNIEGLVLLQLHTAVKIQAPAGTAILLDYSKLDSVIGESQYKKTCSYFIQNQGFFYNFKPSQRWKFSYAHAYETNSHQISMKEKNCLIFLYALFNKFSSDFYRFSTLKIDAFRKFAEYSSYIQSLKDAMELRVEIVEEFYDLKALDENAFPESWNFGDDGSPFLTRVIDFVEELAKVGCFVLMNNFSSHIHKYTHHEVKFLKFIIDHPVNLPFQETLTTVYFYEQFLMAFTQGDNYRYNFRFLKNLRTSDGKNIHSFKLPETNLARSTFETEDYNFGVDKKLVAQLVYFMYFNARKNGCMVNFQNVDEIHKPVKNDETLCERVLEMYARLYHFDKSKIIGSVDLSKKKLFKVDRTKSLPKFPLYLASQDVVEKMKKSLTLGQAMINAHVIGEFHEKFESQLMKFIPKFVDYWPAYFYDKTYQKDRWYPVVDPGTLIKDGIALTACHISTNLARQMGLVQNKKMLEKLSKTSTPIEEPKRLSDQEISKLLEEKEEKIDLVALYKKTNETSVKRPIINFYKKPTCIEFQVNEVVREKKIVNPFAKKKTFKETFENC